MSEQKISPERWGFRDGTGAATVFLTGAQASVALRPILNRMPSGRFEPPADGFYHIIPFGAYAHKATGTTQVLDKPALEAIANRFNAEAAKDNYPGLLTDFEHFSYDPKQSSQAAGWLTAVELREDGLYGWIKWSDLGEAAIQNGRYRYISPVWLPSDCELLDKENGVIRPLRLDSLGLTNSPNLRGMQPLSNRETQQPGAAAASPQTIKTRHMKSVCTLLGLHEDASEAVVHQAVARIMADNTAITNRAGAAEAENKKLKNDQVESDLVVYQNRYAPAMKENVRMLLVSNREAAIGMLQSSPERDDAGNPRPAVVQTRVHNPAVAGSPANRILGAATTGSAGKVDYTVVANRANGLIAQNPRLDWMTAFLQAERLEKVALGIPLRAPAPAAAAVN